MHNRLNCEAMEDLQEDSVVLVDYENFKIYQNVPLTPPDSASWVRISKNIKKGEYVLYDRLFDLIYPPSENKALLEKSNVVSHPAHYNSGKIEVIEAIEDWKMNYHRGNAVKYIARAGRKNPEKEIEDLEKAIWYLNRDIEKMKAAKEGREVLKPNNMVKI